MKLEEVKNYEELLEYTEYIRKAIVWCMFKDKFLTKERKIEIYWTLLKDLQDLCFKRIYPAIWYYNWWIEWYTIDMVKDVIRWVEDELILEWYLWLYSIRIK